VVAHVHHLLQQVSHKGLRAKERREKKRKRAKARGEWWSESSGGRVRTYVCVVDVHGADVEEEELDVFGLVRFEDEGVEELHEHEEHLLAVLLAPLALAEEEGEQDVHQRVELGAHVRRVGYLHVELDLVFVLLVKRLDLDLHLLDGDHKSVSLRPYDATNDTTRHARQHDTTRHDTREKRKERESRTSIWRMFLMARARMEDLRASQ
jgi:hypothetical protein